MITLYTIDCINCKRLENKLKENSIQYEVCRDREKMQKMGMSHMPILEVDGEKMGYKAAVKYLNTLRGAEA